jgi:hypothetical protein
LHSLQSQEILNRPVFVLEILNRVWTLLKILKKSEQSENSEQILNRVWTSLNILNIVWTESEQCLKSLNTHFLYYYSTCDKLIVIKGLINTIRMFFFHLNFIFFFTWNLICALYMVLCAQRRSFAVFIETVCT